MKQFVVLFFACGFLVVLGVPAYAAHGAGGYNWADLAWRTVNFICFVGILWWFVGPKLKAGLRGRREGIAAEFDHLETLKKDARQQLDALQARVANLDAECAAIVAEARQQAETTRDLLVAEARQQAEDMRTQALRAADSEAQMLLRTLREQVADEVIENVRSALGQRLTPLEHERLIDNALKKVVIQ